MTRLAEQIEAESFAGVTSRLRRVAGREPHLCQAIECAEVKLPEAFSTFGNPWPLGPREERARSHAHCGSTPAHRVVQVRLAQRGFRSMDRVGGCLEVNPRVWGQSQLVDAKRVHECITR